MNDIYAYSNFFIEYAFHATPYQIRPHAYFYVLLVAGSYTWWLVLSLRVTNGVYVLSPCKPTKNLQRNLSCKTKTVNNSRSLGSVVQKPINANLGLNLLNLGLNLLNLGLNLLNLGLNFNPRLLCVVQS